MTLTLIPTAWTRVDGAKPLGPQRWTGDPLIAFGGENIMVPKWAYRDVDGVEIATEWLGKQPWRHAVNRRVVGGVAPDGQLAHGWVA